MTETMSPVAAELAAVRAELPRVDAKCGTMTSLSMAGLAFVATQVTHGPMVVRVLMGAAGVVLAAATLVLLVAVIRPRLGTTGFRMYGRMSPEKVRELFADPAAAVDHQERDLIVLATTTDRKYRHLRIAVDLTAVAVAFTAAAMLAGVLS